MSALDYRKEHVKDINELCSKLEKMQHFLSSPLLPTLDEQAERRKDSLKENMQKLDISLHQRLSRVKQDTARVSVIGLEKQGKSTFVNAWIGKQCLPSDTKRCTWASSTLINDKEFRARVKFLTTTDFENAVDGLFKSLNLQRQSVGFPLSESVKARDDISPLTANPAFKDLEQLTQHYSTIRQYLDKPDINIDATSIEQFNARLFEWISLRGKDGKENGQAYAVEHCDIYLPIADDNLLFSVDDLPGIDAPGNRAEEMTWRNVENNADIIVLVKNAFNNASMNNNEIGIWDKAKKSDSAIKLTERLFVALNQADADKNENGRNCHQEAFDEFRAKSVPDNRIFYLSSRAELFGGAEDKSALSFNDWSDEDQKKATESIGKKRNQGKPTTGFPEFKEALYQFLENDFQELEERALRNLKDDLAEQQEKFRAFIDLYQDAEGGENAASEEARERFGELWLPQGREQTGIDGLGDNIRKKLGSMVDELISEPNKTKEFLEGIREEIVKSQEQLLAKNTLDVLV